MVRLEGMGFFVCGDCPHRMAKMKVPVIITILILIILLCIAVMYTSAETLDYAYGVASWYGFSSPGILKTTANMETFDENVLTCATWDYPFNTYLKVTNLENGKSIIVRVNDRGPAERLVKKGRIIDLTKKAFSEIADPDRGLVRAKIEKVGRP